MDHQQLIHALFKKLLGPNEHLEKTLPLGGGCINDVYRLHSSKASYVLKLNTRSKYPDMFKLECQGLHELAESQTLGVPKVIACGDFEDQQYLLMEYITSNRADKNFWILFAQDLADLHRVHGTNHGLMNNNYIGSLAQINTPSNDWISFFISNRLWPLIRIAVERDVIPVRLVKRLEQLFVHVPEILINGPPSLLHGDLWTGNILCGPDQKAVVIDPAVYYGHREIEIAYTGLFGGFDPLFYKVYQESYPMEKGYEERFKIYNLYPLFVHVLLFGPAYLKPIEETLDHFL